MVVFVGPEVYVRQAASGYRRSSVQPVRFVSTARDEETQDYSTIFAGLRGLLLGGLLDEAVFVGGLLRTRSRWSCWTAATGRQAQALDPELLSSARPSKPA